MVTQTSNAVVQVQNFGGKTMQSSKVGQVQFTDSQRFQNVARIPDGKVNLLSVGTICDAGYKVTFNATGCIIQNLRSGKVKYIAPRVNKLYVLSAASPSNVYTSSSEIPLLSTPSTDSCFTSSHSSSTDQADLFHSRLGHMHIQRLQSLHKHTDLLDKVPSFTVAPSPCHTCLSCKATRPPIGKKSLPPSPHILDVCYADIKEFPISPTGMKYFITFIDSASRYTVIHLLKFKSDATAAIHKYFQYCRTTHHAVPRIFHTDNAPDLCAGQLPSFFAANNCTLETCPPNTPEWNGVAERKNRTLDECARSLLHQARLPLTLYSLAVKYACHLQNLWPHRTLHHRIPAALWSNSKVSLKDLRVFGCDTYCLKRNDKQDMTRAQLGIFVGFKERNGCHMVYMPHSGRVWDVRHPTSVETNFTRPLDSPKFSQCGSYYEADPDTPTSAHLPPIPTNSLRESDTDIYPSSTSSTIDAPYLAPLPIAVPLPPPALPHQRQSAINARGRIQAIANYEKPSSSGISSIAPPSAISSIASPSAISSIAPPSAISSVASPSAISSSASPSVPTVPSVTTTPLRRSERISIPTKRYVNAVSTRPHPEGVQFSQDSNERNPVYKVKSHNSFIDTCNTYQPLVCEEELYDPEESLAPSPPTGSSLSSSFQCCQFSQALSAPWEANRGPPLSSSLQGPQFSQSSNETNSALQVNSFSTDLNPLATPFSPLRGDVFFSLCPKVTRDRNVDKLATSNSASTNSSTAEALDVPTEYKEAIETEWNMLHKLGVFTTVPRPPRHIKPIKSKWVLKTKSNGAKKARLTAKGFMQRFGVNYTETFAPVVNATTVRLVIALAASNNLQLHQLDVKSAFLNAPLEETIFMEHPTYFNNQPGDTVLKLNKTLYGLKQAPREWYKLLTDKLQQLGYSQSLNDPCLYFKVSPNQLTLVPFHVDDLKIASNSPAEITNLQAGLSASFELNTVSDNHYLGIEIKEGPDDIQLSQKDFIRELLIEHNLLQCRTVSTPLTDSDLPPAVENPDPQLQHLYRSIVGSLLYISNYTRPDICYPTNYLARFMHGPTNRHLSAATHILRYLAGTLSYSISYKRHGNPLLHTYSDASWSDPIDGRSTSGFLVMAGTAPIAWASCRQHVPALSTCEAEYIGLSTATQTILWLRSLLEELNLFSDQPTILYGDNQAANLLAQNPSSAARTKHINVRFHFLQYYVKNRHISIQYCPTNSNLADLLTKNLAKIKHVQHTSVILNTNSEVVPT